jgi:hypothetical protein
MVVFWTRGGEGGGVDLKADGARGWREAGDVGGVFGEGGSVVWGEVDGGRVVLAGGVRERGSKETGGVSLTFDRQKRFVTSEKGPIAAERSVKFAASALIEYLFGFLVPVFCVW